MKRLICSAFVLLFAISLLAQNPYPDVDYIDARGLTLVGKLMADTPNPYHRVDTVKYKGFSDVENEQVRSSSGLALVFTTDSPTLHVRADYGYKNYDTKTMGLALRGFDLYIKKDGEWLWASSACPRLNDENTPFLLLGGMDSSVKECLVYLPLYSELNSLEIGIAKGSFIKPSDNPFRYRIGVFGSSYTHGISAGRPGMAYPAQLSRMTGLQFLSLGCSGNCKMQDYFADVLCDSEVDAFLFDTFSNPDPDMIAERLFPFIEKLQKAHPGIPLIFQQTIYRERRNFNIDVNKNEQAKQDMAEKKMEEACRKYKDVYFIHPNATSSDHETSVDGTHPSDEGYRIWAESIRKPLRKILKKYGIR